MQLSRILLHIAKGIVDILIELPQYTLELSYTNDAPLIHPFQPVASTINTLAGALYQVFCASPDPARKEMREACFDYLSLGGVFSSGPVSLLSGLNPRPLSLFCHFFAVAIYGVTRLLIPFPSPKRIWIGVRLITVHISRHLHINLHSP